MSTSRRSFVKAGLIATAFAALPLKTIVGQSWKQRDGNPGETPPAQVDPLRNYSKATFVTYLNSIFQLHTVTGIVEVTLVSVDDMPAPKGGECFVLTFVGGSSKQQQDTYTLVHPSLGTFQLFLVPGVADQNGAQGYLATINRLSLADAAKYPPPKAGTRSQPATKTVTPPPSSTQAPAQTPAPSTSPNTAPPVQSVTPPAPPAKKPNRTRKPSWKFDDIEDPLIDIN